MMPPLDRDGLTQRRAKVLADLQQAQTKAAGWAQWVQQLTGQLMLLDELLGADGTTTPTPSDPA